MLLVCWNIFWGVSADPSQELFDHLSLILATKQWLIVYCYQCRTSWEIITDLQDAILEHSCRKHLFLFAAYCIHDCTLTAPTRVYRKTLARDFPFVHNDKQECKNFVLKCRLWTRPAFIASNPMAVAILTDHTDGNAELDLAQLSAQRNHFQVDEIDV